MYKLIDPSDPISQREWAKQAVVRRVRSRPGTDKDGNASEDVLSDTIDVFATFTDSDGFFGLTSYLKYATSQLSASYGIVLKSRHLSPRKYEFPWRFIDDSNIEVDGFLKQTFGFELDQDKILDLLTGHTLYNDSNVVVRELVQNAIDAVRLQCGIDHSESDISGSIDIYWNT